jgi:hypothetical protein
MFDRLTCIVLTIPVILSFASCSRISKEEVTFYKQLDSTLINGNMAIQASTNGRLKSLEAKATDPNIITAEKAKKWHTKAEEIFSSTNDVYRYINELKMQLRQQGADEENTSLVTKIFSQAKNEELHQKIINCKNQLLNIDPDITSTLGTSIPLNDSTDTEIKDIPLVVAMTKLSKLQSDLKQSENMLIIYCDKKATIMDDSYDKFQIISYGNSERYYVGERAKIFSGVGSYSNRIVPEITVRGRKAERTPNGDYESSFNVGYKPGTYEVPVQISYIDPNTGQPSTLIKIIRYTVAPVCPGN